MGFREWNATVLQLISDICDINIPATTLEIVNHDDGFLGLVGTFSSLIGIYNVWEKCRQ
jgi:peroxin-11B